MTDLTDKWKKGELLSGEYYIKAFGKVCIDYYCSDTDSFYLDDEDIEQVLAPVPSYSEYLALQSDRLAKDEGVEINAELEAENAKLKELLESALSWLDLGWLPDSSKLRAGRYAQLQNLKRKIKEVLK